jgi:hypothetical protein
MTTTPRSHRNRPRLPEGHAITRFLWSHLEPERRLDTAILAGILELVSSGRGGKAVSVVPPGGAVGEAPLVAVGPREGPCVMCQMWGYRCDSSLRIGGYAAAPVPADIMLYP